MNEWMNDAFIQRFYCVLPYTQSALQSCGGLSSTTTSVQHPLGWAKEVQPASGAAKTVKLCHHRSVLCSSITVWFGSATKTDIRRLQRTVRTAERIIGAPLPSLQELYTSRVRKRAKKVTLDPSHPAHSLFELLPSGRRYRSLSTKTARHKNSFFPRPYPTRTTHNTPQDCTSVNNSNLHLYIGHMHIHSSVYGHFSFVYFYFLLQLLFLIIVYSLHYFIVLYYLNYMLSALCLYFLYWKLLTPRQIPCVCKHTWQ